MADAIALVIVVVVLALLVRRHRRLFRRRPVAELAAPEAASAAERTWNDVAQPIGLTPQRAF